jgi:hypothetical protein
MAEYYNLNRRKIQNLKWKRLSFDIYPVYYYNNNHLPVLSFAGSMSSSIEKVLFSRKGRRVRKDSKK